MNPRAIEAGARALRNLAGMTKFDLTDTQVNEAARCVITAYEANLKAEGFVAVTRENLQYIAEHSGERTIREKARAMLSAAQEQ